MQVLTWGAFFLLSLGLFVQCNKDKDPSSEEKIIEKIIDETPVDPYTIAKKLVGQAGWPEEVELDFELGSMQLLNYKRTVLTGDIVHYSFQVAMGPHQYDKIGVHRVVKEATAGMPLVTNKAIFYQHGDLKDFIGMMIPSAHSPSMPRDFGLAIFLAKNGIDVWGIDQAWCAVPADATDFSFFKDFGLEKTSRDLRNAMAIARIARYLTGNPLDKMNLAGYSSGVSTSYAACNLETQLESDKRHIKGLIAIDVPIKTTSAVWNQAWESEIELYKEPYDQGIYEVGWGITLVASLGRTNPSGDSPLFPGFTNKEVVLFFGCANSWVSESPFHYWAADWSDDFPANPKYTTYEQILDFFGSAIEYQPNRFEYEFVTLVGNTHDSPFDDHFAAIKAPIFNISPRGGFDDLLAYGSGLTGSTDVTNLIVSLETPENALIDFGHVDLFTAYNAQTMWWEDLLGWLQGH